MEFILIIQLALFLPVLGITLYNALFRRSLKRYSDKSTAKVSVLIPARDEEKNIETCLQTIISSEVHNLEIIVLDDNSTDKTAEIIQKVINSAPKSVDVKLIKGKAVPEKWLGKNWACQQLFEHSTGDYLVFVDADVTVDSWLINSSLRHMESIQLRFLSIFPKQITKTIGEKLTVPYLQWMLLSFLPLKAANQSKVKSFAAANGQFMMFERSAYIEVGGHGAVANEVVEDIALAKRVKGANIPMEFLILSEGVYCRMYTKLEEAVHGLSKNVIRIVPLPILIYINLLNLVVMLGSVVLVAQLPQLSFIILLIVIQRFIASNIYKQPWHEAILSIFPQTLIMFYIQLIAVTNNFGRGQRWKKRLLTN